MSAVRVVIVDHIFDDVETILGDVPFRRCSTNLRCLLTAVGRCSKVTEVLGCILPVLILPHLDSSVEIFLQVDERVLVVVIQELADYLESLIDRIRRVRSCPFTIEFEKDSYLDEAVEVITSSTVRDTCLRGNPRN